MTQKMSLCRALNILSEVHTNDDDLIGYSVNSPPFLNMISKREYIEAWGAVRQAIGKISEPEVPGK